MSGGGKYATGTTVSVGQTRTEIERTLARYGASGFMFAQDEQAAAVGFLIRGRHVRFTVPLPRPDDQEFTHTPTRQARTTTQAEGAWQKAVRARWRGLGLIVKAKLEAVDAGVTSFDDEFLAQLVMPDNRTVGQALAGQVQAAVERGEVPALMPGRRA